MSMVSASHLPTAEEGILRSRAERISQQARDRLEAAETCCAEVRTFLPLIATRLKGPHHGGLSAFLQRLEHEHSSVQKLLAGLEHHSLTEEVLKKTKTLLDPSLVEIDHGVFQWALLKRGRSFMAINQTFHGLSKEARKKKVADSQLAPREKQSLHRRLRARAKVEVDVMDWGREWVCIRWIQQDRLARQMTECGWAWGDHELDDRVDRGDWEDSPLAQYVERLVAAAKLNRCDYRIPKIRLVFPNLDRQHKDLVIYLEQLKSIDSQVQLLLETREDALLSMPSPGLSKVASILVGDEKELLTPTLNLDHTILVDLISDITHCKLQSRPWQSPSTRHQIEEEAPHADGLMARILYHLLQDRKLVCTREAALHFRQMLQTVGTPTEKARGKILVPLDDCDAMQGSMSAREKFAELSVYALPHNVQVPMTVLQEDWSLSSIERAASEGILPAVASDVARRCDFKSSKLSIFMYGWASGNVTVTSNREIRGQLKTLVEANRHDVTELGPQVWRVDVTRNLLAASADPPRHDNG